MTCGQRQQYRTGSIMKRRQFITLLGSAAAGWPHVARRTTADNSGNRVPQQQVAHRVGIGRGGVLPRSERGRLVVGQNVEIAFRWADGHYDRLPALATDLA